MADDNTLLNSDPIDYKEQAAVRRRARRAARRSRALKLEHERFVALVNEGHTPTAAAHMMNTSVPLLVARNPLVKRTVTEYRFEWKTLALMSQAQLMRIIRYGKPRDKFAAIKLLIRMMKKERYCRRCLEEEAELYDVNMWHFANVAQRRNRARARTQ